MGVSQLMINVFTFFGRFSLFESIPHMLRKAPTNLAELKTRLRVRAHGSTNL